MSRRMLLLLSLVVLASGEVWVALSQMPVSLAFGVAVLSALLGVLSWRWGL